MGINNYFSYHRSCLKYVGISLSGNENRLFLLHTFLMFGVRITWSLLLVVEICNNVKNIRHMMITVMFIFGLWLEFGKSIVLYFNRVKVGKSADLLEEGVFLPNEERGIEGRKLIAERVRIGNRQVITGNILGLSAVSLIVMTCYIKRLKSSDPTKWELPLGPNTLIDASSSPNYEFVMLSQWAALYSASTSYISCDAFFSSILSHISVQCKILTNYIRLFKIKSYRRMVKEPGETNGTYQLNEIDQTKIPWQYLKCTLVEIVDYHSAIIDLATSFEEVFNKIMLVEFVGVIMVLCTALYDSSMYPMADPRCYQGLMVISAMVPQISILGYYGSEVMADSEEIAKASYEIDFVGADMRFQKGMSLVILRSQKPITFTVGKFTALAVTTSIMIIKFSVSYFMVLQNTQQKV